MNPEVRALLEKEDGMAEYIPLLEAAGMSSMQDLANVTEKDLVAIGVDKLFHRRRLLRIAKGTSTFPDVGIEADVNEPADGRIRGGDRIIVTILGASGHGEGVKTTLSDREHYVKVSLCKLDGKTVVPDSSTTCKTVPQRGPYPIWGNEEEPSKQSTFNFKTDFRTHLLSFELKEKHLIGDNRIVGVVIFPPKFFFRFKDDTIVDDWFPLKVQEGGEKVVRGHLRIRFTVPGGCPIGARTKSYHVRAVHMNARKLRVTVFEAKINRKANPNQMYGEALKQAQSEPAPTTVVQLELDNPEHTKFATATVKESFHPSFDETFEFFTEVSNCKLLSLKLMKEKGILSSRETVGTVRIPLQFYLSQPQATDLDQVYPMLDEENVQKGNVHVRLEVRSRTDMEKKVSFTRTESVRERRDNGATTPVEDVERELETVLVDSGDDSEPS